MHRISHTNKIVCDEDNKGICAVNLRKRSDRCLCESVLHGGRDHVFLNLHCINIIGPPFVM